MKMFIVAAFALVSMTATAQRTERVIDRIDQRTVQEFDHQETTQSFKSHWFLTLQGGAQYTLGEAKFKKLISPNVQLGIGYQFNPWFAARLQANGWQSKGGWNGHRTQIGNTPFTADYKYKYVAPGIDLMFNLSNLLCGWNPDRVFNVTAFIGGGANIAFSNDEVNEIGTVVKNLRGGLQLGFRLSDAVQLLLEGNANILSDKYNSKKADNPDWYFNALAGLRVNLGKVRNVNTFDVMRDVVVYDTIWKTVIIEDPIIKIDPIRRDVFFQRNKSVIEESELSKIADIAEYLNQYPQAMVDIRGYADVQTGNAKINDRLSRERADVVVKKLIEDYGISADRITYSSYGDTVQPFTENDLNRVSICIAEVKD